MGLSGELGVYAGGLVFVGLGLGLWGGGVGLVWSVGLPIGGPTYIGLGFGFGFFWSVR